MRYGYPYGIEGVFTIASVVWFIFAFMRSDWIGIASAAALATLVFNLSYGDLNE